MSTAQALAHMALDRYLNTQFVDSEEADDLRYLATQHPSPPMWSVEWERTHKSLELAGRRAANVAPRQLPRRFGARWVAEKRERSQS